MTDFLIQCYNKSCGKKFDPTNNEEGSCVHHPGAPVFHEGLKGWSCCKKRSTDFTEFLNMPGCTKGKHSNEKPPEPEATRQDSSPETVIVKGPPPKGVPDAIEDRPPIDTPAVPLMITVSPSLKPALEKRLAELALQDKDFVEDGESGIKSGTTCYNRGCNETYKDETSLKSKCLFHPGQPIFHEGLKFWSCCKRKTTDFSTFLAQQGCESGNHVWTSLEGSKKQVECRVDWHQTPSVVSVATYAKAAVPESCEILASPVMLHINIVFDAGQQSFKRDVHLHRVIDPTKSSVKILGAKVEVNLHKAVSCSWAHLEYKEQD